MHDELRERIGLLSTTSALLFSVDDINRVRVPEDAYRVEYIRMVELMNVLRSKSKDIRFVYLLRPTDDPSIFSFVADADSLDPFPPFDDLNGDGIVNEDDERVAPSAPYDVREIPNFHRALSGTYVTEEPYSDQWGTYISAFSPVVDRKGQPVAVLGVDVDISRYEELTERIFSPAFFLIAVIGGALLAVFSFSIIQSRKFEGLRQLEADRRALVDLASHQLGVPLTTFKWWLEILKEQDGGRLCRESDVCVQLDEGIRRMDEIIGAIHSVDNRNSSDRATSCNFAVITEQAVREAQDILQRKKQRCDLDIPASLPDIRMDATLLRGALAELIQNASSYSPDASVITVRALQQRKMVRISVIDKGDGIAPADLPNIAQKFVRGTYAYRRKPVGNGLGLWIVRSIVERAKGSLKVESALGKGTTVTLELPVA